MRSHPLTHYRLGLILLLAGVAACQSPLSPSEMDRVIAGRHRWAERGFVNYSIETSVSCFCLPELNQWARIEVVNGHISRVTLLQSREVITDDRKEMWSTVIRLDPVLGFPTEVNWIPEQGIQDAGALHSMRNAQPLP